MREIGTVFCSGLYAAVALVGFLFIFDFKVRKPSVKQVFVIVAVVAAAVAVIVFAWRGWWSLVNTRG